MCEHQLTGPSIEETTCDDDLPVGQDAHVECSLAAVGNIGQHHAVIAKGLVQRASGINTHEFDARVGIIACGEGVARQNELAIGLECRRFGEMLPTWCTEEPLVDQDTICIELRECHVLYRRLQFDTTSNDDDVAVRAYEQITGKEVIVAVTENDRTIAGEAIVRCSRLGKSGKADE